MSEEIHNRILAFLANALARTEHDTVVKIELTYSPQGGYRADPLRVWKRDDPNDRPLFIDDDGKPNHVYTQKLTAEIVELATNHADSYGTGKHRFVIRAHKHLNGYLTHAFAVLPSFDSDDQALTAGATGAGAELVPTPTGLVSQLMRHLEIHQRNAKEMMQSYMAGMSHQAEQLRAEIDSLRAQRDAQAKERMEWLDTIEQARSQDHNRQIEAMTVTSREERKSLVAKKFIALAPVALSHWMGSGKSKKPTDANGTPAKPPSPLAQLVKKLFDSLNEDQRAQIAAALGMEQQILLVEIADVVENGDSVLLPQMLHDLVSTFTPAQIGSLMSLMSGEQRVLFVQAMKLATAQATSTDPSGQAKPTEEPQTEVS